MTAVTSLKNYFLWHFFLFVDFIMISLLWSFIHRKSANWSVRSIFKLVQATWREIWRERRNWFPVDNRPSALVRSIAGHPASTFPKHTLKRVYPLWSSTFLSATTLLHTCLLVSCAQHTLDRLHAKLAAPQASTLYLKYSSIFSVLC